MLLLHHLQDGKAVLAFPVVIDLLEKVVDAGIILLRLEFGHQITPSGWFVG